jgi:hypothetical protein
MMERPIGQGTENNSEKEQLKEDYIELAKELSREVFVFPGIDPEAELKLKSVDESYPGYATPINELAEKLKNGGMKVVLAGENVYILPLDSDDIENGSIFPRQLQIVAGMDDRLANLIKMGREFYSLCH